MSFLTYSTSCLANICAGVFLIVLNTGINDTIILEQIIIKDEANELLNIKGFTSPEALNCQNGVLNEAEAKSELSIAFRQVSHLVDNKNNGFSFNEFFLIIAILPLIELISYLQKLN